jgi:hypothetical protein
MVGESDPDACPQSVKKELFPKFNFENNSLRFGGRHQGHNEFLGAGIRVTMNLNWGPLSDKINFGIP